MALLRYHDDDEWHVYRGIMIVCDALSPAQSYDEPPPLDLGAGGTALGTFATSGHGWLWLAAESTYHRVRIEAHDARPPDDPQPWTDLAEMPYLSGGWVVDDSIDGGMWQTGILELGPPGPYRVRVARRPADDEGDHWLIQFWPDPACDPPVWLRRNDDAASWRRSAGYIAGDLLVLARWSPGSAYVGTVAQLAERLLLDPATVAAGLRAAGEPDDLQQSLDVTGDQADPAATLVLRPRPQDDPEGDYAEDEGRDEALDDTDADAGFALGTEGPATGFLTLEWDDEHAADTPPPAGPPWDGSNDWTDTDVEFERDDQDAFPYVDPDDEDAWRPQPRPGLRYPPWGPPPRIGSSPPRAR